VWGLYRWLAPEDIRSDGKNLICSLTKVKGGQEVPCTYRMKAPTSGTGNLFRHPDKYHKEAAVKARQGSNHSHAAQASRSAVIALATGQQPTIETALMAPRVRAAHDRRYVIMCATDLRPDSMIATDGMKIFLGGFSPAYVGTVRAARSAGRMRAHAAHACMLPVRAC
jgi:hypothetical protein